MSCVKGTDMQAIDVCTPIFSQQRTLKLALLFWLLLNLSAIAQKSQGVEDPRPNPNSKPYPAGQLRIPNREQTPLFKGKPGNQKTEIRFDPATRRVTVKLLVQDPNGYFIPNIRPDNFVIYENGVRQQNATVEVEHAPVSLALLVEFGGRSQALNRALGLEISRTGRQLVNALTRNDKMGVWKYADKVDKLADFSPRDEKLEMLFYELGEPEFSEANLYDSVVLMMRQMQPLKGRKAIMLISSGIDTSSKTKREDVLKAAENSDTPIYAVSLAPELRQTALTLGSAEPYARIDWRQVEGRLLEIARASGGRGYAPDSTIDLSPVYDDAMENLKVRYVISYQPSSDLNLDSPRTVRVELVDPKTGGPLKIVDASGRTIRAKVIVQDSYIPSAVAGEARNPARNNVREMIEGRDVAFATRSKSSGTAPNKTP
jgi:VWFA-related protein